MKLKTIILSAIAVLGMATPTFAKSKVTKNTDNNVSSGMDQVAEQDLKVYGSAYTDGDKFRLTHWKFVSRKRLTSSSPRKWYMWISETRISWQVSPTV